jgi:hypothetical protein
MSDPISNAEIEDVLSSIRRLVTEETRKPDAVALERDGRDSNESPQVESKLVLTPALRVSGVEERPASESAPVAQPASAPAARKDFTVVGGSDLEQDEDEATIYRYGADEKYAEEAISDSGADLDFLPSREETGDRKADEAGVDTENTDEIAFNDAVAEKLQAIAAAKLATGVQPSQEPERKATGKDVLQLVETDQSAPETPEGTEETLRLRPETRTDTAWEDAGEDAVTEAAPEDNGAEPVVFSARPRAKTRPVGDVDDAPENAQTSAMPDGETAEEADAPTPEIDDKVQEWIDEETAPTAGDQTVDVEPSITDPHQPDTTDVQADVIDAAYDQNAQAFDVQDDDVEALLDEDALRDMVAQIVREELRGPLGEKITRNVRKLVRREIHRALTSQELE